MAGKGRPKTGGRVKNTPNKVTTSVRKMILEALDESGGVRYLVEQAQANPIAFMILIGKVIPTEIKADINATLAVKHKIVGIECRK